MPHKTQNLLKFEKIMTHKPLWLALSNLFLDTEITDNTRKHIARIVLQSPLTREQVHQVLWLEVFPALCENLRIVTGEWAGFNETWLVNRIINVLSGVEKSRFSFGLISVKQVTSIIDDEWRRCCTFIRDDYYMEPLG